VSEDGRKVLVTGASGAIGAAVAEMLVAGGWRAAMQGRDRSRLEAVADRVAAGGKGAAVPLVCDLAMPDERASLVGRAVEALGGLDALVQAAGIAEHAPALALDEAAVRAQIEVNLIAPMLLARDAARFFVERAEGGGGAVIVNVTSTLAFRSAPRTLAYGSSKAGLAQATRAFALELAPLGVRVNAVAPGVIDTPMVGRPRPDRTRGESPDAEETLAELARLHPLGRVGTPREVAEAVVYLLEAEFATGTVLVLDGGLTA
jgi:NAD(P)-dependent dehydrogenase (short-subunit alcohol dehydrogenase family)